MWIKYFDIDKGVLEVTLVVKDGIVIDRKLGLERVHGVDSHLGLTSLGIAIPGAIDIHAHLRGLDLAYKEDEESGTLAAAKGGFTVVVDMPNTKPEIRSLTALRSKLEALKTNSAIDYGIFIGLPSNLRELKEMLSQEGVVGLKVYPQDLLKLNREHIEVLAELDSLLMLHAEHPAMIREGCERGKRWICRPIEAEIAAISYLKKVVAPHVKIHVTHVTNVATLALAKSIGATVDTCPHYLLLTCEDEEKLGCIAKVNPPLRPRDVVEELLNNVNMLDSFSTDHAPHSIEEKCLDFSECPSGIASIEIAIPLTIDLAMRGFMLLDDIVRLWSIGPSKILGLRNWGCIEVGCIASYTIINPDKVTIVDPSQFVSKAKFSPYEGWKLRGGVVGTIVRGRIVSLEGELIESRGGKAIERGSR